MTRDEDPHRDQGAEDDDAPGPTDETDAATKADMGLPGSPEQSYSPEGMEKDDEIDG